MKKNSFLPIALIVLFLIVTASSSSAAPEVRLSHPVDRNAQQKTLLGPVQGAFFHYNQGIKYLVQEQFDHALRSFSNAIRINGTFVEGYIKRGDAWYLKGDNEMAINDYNTAIALNPDYPESYLGRGLAYKNLGQIKKSEEDLRNACHLGSKEACRWQSASPCPI